MNLRYRLAVICTLVIVSLSAIGVAAETSIRSLRVRTIMQMVSQDDFPSAIDSSRQLVVEEPSNPVGYFLLGVIYYSILNQYRNDNYCDSTTNNLDTAISLSRSRIDEGSNQADIYFVLGSAYGCRALYRSVHGGWWGAFRDGHNSCSNLEKALDRDSTLTDAFSVIGAYHYWKSAKAKVFSWLPFVGDKRKQGITEIYEAISAKGMMSLNARKSLLAIYLNEKRYEGVVEVTDTLASLNLLDVSCRFQLVQALIKLRRWDEARRALTNLQTDWESIPYGNPCGANEGLYQRASLAAEQGDTSAARGYIRQILSADSTCNSSAYYRQTVSKARELLH